MAHTTATDVHRGTRRLSPWQHHFLEMFAVMVVGMVAAAVGYCFAIGMRWDEALVHHPAGTLAVVAAGMTVPMAAWMLHCGMGARNTAEMAVAMAAPVVPFLLLVQLGVTKSAQCGAYCLVAVAAMVGLMLYRHDEYSLEMAH